jgi:mono/diheme cytochrome c family protein
VFRNQTLKPRRRQLCNRRQNRLEHLSRFALVAAVLAMALAAGTGVARADGRGIFLSNCAVCHQPSGKGVPGVYPPLAGSVGRYVALKDGRTYLIRVLANGMGGKIQVGNNTFEGDMPPWPQLSDQQIADVLDYVLTGLNAKLLPAHFKPITAAEVKAERTGQFSSDQLHAERESLLKALSAKAAK